MRRIILSLFTIFLTALSLNADTVFPLSDPGTQDFIDYEQFGYYLKPGTPQFEFVITNHAGLSLASGEGIDPCRTLTNSPAFLKAVADGRLRNKNPFKQVGSKDPQLDYFVWSQAGEEPGICLLFVAKALEKGGHLFHALKAYRASMVIYPDSTCWSSGGEFQWSSAEASWNGILNLLRKNPDMNLKLVDADVSTVVKPSGMEVSVTPGRFDYVTPPLGYVDLSTPSEEIGDPNEIIDQRGTGTVQLVQYGDKQWRMFVNKEPYFIYGMNYAPVKVGEKPWEWDWTWSDENTNGTIDIFEVWIDKNKNNRQDDDELITTDGQLLKDIGCNTIRLYITDAELPTFNVMLFRKLYHDYGIRVILGNFAGAYCHGSGATWENGTDYTSFKQQDRMIESITNMVEKLKGEPWVLAWILGNENNMAPSETAVNATRTNAGKYPETYARFLNKAAKAIHDIDPNHPVGIGNLLTGLVDYYGKFAPEIDYIGVNSYLGEDGFGSTWTKVKNFMNRPVLITEFGCDAYWTGKGPDEEAAAKYIVSNWEDIMYNKAGHPGAGNSIGGFVFEWIDEWWKHTINYFEDPDDHHCTHAVFPMPFPDGYAQEEWFGLFSQGNGNQSPFQRVYRKGYFSLQETWLQCQTAGKEEPQQSTPTEEEK